MDTSMSDTLPGALPDTGPDTVPVSTTDPANGAAKATTPRSRSAPIEATARWFDGRYNIPLPVHVRLMRGKLELRRDRDDLAPLRQYAAQGLDAGEAWRGAPTPVQLPDGGTLWIEAGSALGEALGSKTLPARLISRWRSVAASLMVLIALIVWFDRQGAGLAAGVLLPLIPSRVDTAIGDAAERQVRSEWLTDSEVDEDRQDAIDERFHEMARKHFPGVKLKLEFARLARHQNAGDHGESAPTGAEGEDDEEGSRARSAGGVNAFALPNGTIVLLDGLTNQLTDDQLMAVLAHEIGHVKHRHAVRGVLQGLGLVAMSGVVLGDYSTAVSSMVGAVQTLRYQREAERQSDAEAQRVLREDGLPPDTLVQVWRMLARNEPAAVSDWPAWLSTHPDTQERIESAQRAQADGGR